MTTQEKLEEIKKKVGQNSLFIGRIPPQTKEEFIKVANEEFVGDYGMLIKWLLDFRKGILSTQNQMIMERIEILANEIESMKSTPEKKKVIRSVAGTKIAEIKR